MRLVPQTLYGRLVIVLLAAVVGLQLLVGVIMVSQRPFESAADSHAGQLGESLSSLALVVATLTDSQLASIHDDLVRRGVEVRTAAPQNEAPDEPDRSPLAQALWKTSIGRQLLWVRVQPGAVVESSGMARQNSFDLALRASDTRFLLVSGTTSGMRMERLPNAVWFDIAVRLVVVALVALVITRWLVSPLKRMAEQANRLGTDLHAKPMIESGSIEMRESTRAFNSMQARISMLLEERTRMLTAISHDLRTPITRVLLRLEMSAATPERDRSIADLSQLTAMINETLQYVRSDATAPPATALNLSELVAGCVNQIDKRQITFQAQDTPWVLGKALSLQRMTMNLIDNALRYGRTATLRMYVQKAQCVLEVSDDGPGIPESDLERVFEPFYRVDKSRNAGSGGTGLGLSIARHVALAHGGEIRLRNRATGGLSVTVTLPRLDTSTETG
mgnify:CR=1 FL=1